MNTPTATFPSSTAADAAKRVVDKSAEAAHEALNSTRGAANRTLEGLSRSVDSARDAAVPAVQQAAQKTEQFGQHAVDMVRQSAQQLREKAQHATEASVVYVRQEPIKSVLMAAAVGAGLMAIATLLMSRQGSR